LPKLPAVQEGTRAGGLVSSTVGLLLPLPAAATPAAAALCIPTPIPLLPAAAAAAAAAAAPLVKLARELATLL
jgi:hypothetical protein